MFNANAHNTQGPVVDAEFDHVGTTAHQCVHDPHGGLGRGIAGGDEGD